MIRRDMAALDLDHRLRGIKLEGPLLRLPAGLTLREVERRYILGTLQKVRGNRTGAARLLGISVRCLQYKLKTYQQERRVSGGLASDDDADAALRPS